MTKLKSLKPFIPAYSFATLILIGSSIPTDRLNRLQRQIPIMRILLSDFVIHFFAFAILVILLGIGYIKANKPKFWWAKAAAASLFVGVLVEVIQLFLPYRSFSTGDLGVDIIGIIAALVPFVVINEIDGK
ncbi:MAG: VanZ family protein [Candidatus Aminicenantes bacterium]|nr:MAG: VanZ family protein [Candidatus Aminicenantes bacterium]